MTPGGDSWMFWETNLGKVKVEAKPGCLRGKINNLSCFYSCSPFSCFAACISTSYVDFLNFLFIYLFVCLELFHFVSAVVEIQPWIDRNFIHLLFELSFTQQFALKGRELLGLQHFFYWLWVGDFEGIYFLFIRKTICLQSCQR